MKKQTKSNLHTSLQTLGIIFLLFFAMAFACDDENGGNSQTNSTRPADIPQTNNNGGSCSTESEFRSILQRDYLKLRTTRNDIKQTEISITSFNVVAPITYSPVYNSKIVEIYPAYPVTVNYFAREFRFGKITESDFEGASFYCYKNPEDYASRFPPEDDRFPKNACVCIQQNSEGTVAADSRECSYDENDPNKTCSGNK